MAMVEAGGERPRVVGVDVLGRRKYTVEFKRRLVKLVLEPGVSVAEIAHLKLWIAKLRRHQFGRRSERAGALLNQLKLQLEDLEVGVAERDARTDLAVPRPVAPAAARAGTLSARRWILRPVAPAAAR
jgi:transposase-like protein